MSPARLEPLETRDELQPRRSRHKRCWIGSDSSLLADMSAMHRTGPAAAEQALETVVGVLVGGSLESLMSPPETTKRPCL